LAALSDDVRAGQSLSQAMERHPRTFSAFYSGLVNVGETSGTLPEVLDKMAEYLEQEHAVKTKLRGATLYPAALFVLALAACLIILTFVLPVFAELFQNAGQPLPRLTRLTLAAGERLRRVWPGLLLALAAAAAGAAAWIRTAAGRRRYHRFLLRLPLAGPIYRLTLGGRLAFMLSLAVRSGIPLLQALALVREVIGNVGYQDALRLAGYRLLDGERLGESLADSGLFDDAFLLMLSVGEETGAMDDMLKNIAGYYDTEVRYRLDLALALVEPGLILAVGALVGLIVIATLLPMFDFMNLV
jgi:type II secretory pathway component PulF